MLQARTKNHSLQKHIPYHECVWHEDRFWTICAIFAASCVEAGGVRACISKHTHCNLYSIHTIVPSKLRTQCIWSMMWWCIRSLVSAATVFAMFSCAAVSTDCFHEEKNERKSAESETISRMNACHRRRRRRRRQNKRGEAPARWLIPLPQRVALENRENSNPATLAESALCLISRIKAIWWV